MESQISDQDVRDLYLRNAPVVGDEEIWEVLEGRLPASARPHHSPSPKQSPRKPRRPLRALGLGFVALVLVAGLGTGIFEAVTYLGRDRVTIVIGDETTTLSPIETVQTYLASWAWEIVTVPRLATEADVIVRGQVVEEPSARWNSVDGKQWIPKDSSEGPQFYTTWMVRVDEVLKGLLQTGDLVPFRFVGGTVEFNGRFAHYVGNDYPELKPGDEVIILGSGKTTMQGTFSPPGYWLIGGGLSVFRLQDREYVRVIRGGGSQDTDKTTPEQIKELLGTSSTVTSSTVRVGVMIPADILFKGRIYAGVGQVVRVGSNTPADLSLVGSGSAADVTGAPSDSQYATYAIKGIDQNEAIAVKFQGRGSSGPIWVWLKYERKT